MQGYKIMSELHSIQHDLKRDIHNIVNLLKFINSDEEIKDPEIKSMLNMALDREKKIFDSLDTLFLSRENFR